jgi:hypothetical protein
MRDHKRTEGTTELGITDTNMTIRRSEEMARTFERNV